MCENKNMHTESIPAWAEEFIEMINKECHTKLTDLCIKLEVFGLEPNELQKTKSSILNGINEVLDDYIQEVQDRQEHIANEIKSLLQRSEELCKELSISLPDYGKDNLGLFKERNLLKEKVEEFESMRANRIKTIEALENCEQQLCKNLGCTPKGLMCFPLPSQKLILSFENYLEDMEKEKFIRRERLCKKKEEIIQIVKKLGIQPFMDFEKTVIEGDDSMFLVTDDNMEKLEHLHQSLKQQLSDSEEEAENLSKKVEKLWNVLEVDEQERDLFRNKCVGTVFQKIALLKEELKRCDLLKCKNIQLIIEKLREQLHHFWAKMQYTEEQRDSFPFLNTSVYTEDLLEIHEREVQKLEALYEKNSEIYLLLEKYTGLFEEMKKLEKSEDQPERYKNRGGQLLKEEKERNRLLKKVSLVEEKLLRLAENYFINEGKPFYVYGQTIQDYINQLRDQQKAERILRMSAKKQQREQALTPGRSRFLASSSCIKTPNTTSKRKNVTPLPETDKRLKLALFRETKQVRTAPTSSSQFGVKTTNKIRRSLERVKKLNKKKKSLNKEYSAFENDLENLDPNKRSTAALDKDNEVLAQPLATPRKLKPAVLLTTPKGNQYRNLQV